MLLYKFHEKVKTNNALGCSILSILLHFTIEVEVTLSDQILINLSVLVLISHNLSPPHCPDKTEKPVSMNIKLRLAEEGELEEGATRGPTLEFVLEKDKVLLKEEEEEEFGGRQRQPQQQQFCTKAAENDRTEPCSAGSSQTPSSNSGPDTNP